MAEFEQEDGEGATLPKKMIFIIVAVVVVLLAAGVGVTYFLMKGDAPKAEKSDEHEVSVEKLYFEMSKPMVVDFPKGSIVEHGRISVTMLVEGAETLAVVKKNEPMIRNNLLMLIGAQDAANLNTREGKEQLRLAMLDNVAAVVKKMAKKGHVDEIFFTSFVMQ